jgi:hypothetical protein
MLQNLGFGSKPVGLILPGWTASVFKDLISALRNTVVEKSREGVVMATCNYLYVALCILR